MYRKGLLALLMAACLLGNATAGTDAAEKPGLITPLLVGANAPEATMTGPEGNQVTLAELTADKASVIIFYRGAW